MASNTPPDLAARWCSSAGGRLYRWGSFEWTNSCCENFGSGFRGGLRPLHSLVEFATIPYPQTREGFIVWLIAPFTSSWVAPLRWTHLSLAAWCVPKLPNHHSHTWRIWGASHTQRTRCRPIRTPLVRAPHPAKYCPQAKGWEKIHELAMAAMTSSHHAIINVLKCSG